MFEIKIKWSYLREHDGLDWLKNQLMLIDFRTLFYTESQNDYTLKIFLVNLTGKKKIPNIWIQGIAGKIPRVISWCDLFSDVMWDGNFENVYFLTWWRWHSRVTSRIKRRCGKGVSGGCSTSFHHYNSQSESPVSNRFLLISWKDNFIHE